MAKKDLQSGWALLADLFRETSWGVRLGILTGLALAMTIFALLLGGSLSGLGTQTMIGLAVGLLIVGGFAGCLVGVALEALVPGLRQRDEKRRKRPTSHDRKDRR